MMIRMNNASDRSNETPAQTAERYRARYSESELRKMAAVYRLDRVHRAPGARPLPGRYAIAARIVGGAL